MNPVGLHHRLLGAHPAVRSPRLRPAVSILHPTKALREMFDHALDGAVALWFRTLDRSVGAGAAWTLRGMWHLMSATARPVLTTSSFAGTYGVMAVIGVAVALPLLAVGAIQAIWRQDASGLLRSALIRLPVAVVCTFAAVQLVQLGLSATDSASTAILNGGGDPARLLVDRIAAASSALSVNPAAAFAGFLVVLIAAFVGFLLWFELAVRAAAVAVATLFLPLALAGSAWPATAHWCRRLAETLAGLILMKLVMAAVLALAAGALAQPTGGGRIGVAGAVEGIALLALTAFAPFTLFRLIPMIEAGAVGHLEGQARRPLAVPAEAARGSAMRGANQAALGFEDGLAGLLGRGASGGGGSSSGSGGPGAGSGSASGGGGASSGLGGSAPTAGGTASGSTPARPPAGAGVSERGPGDLDPTEVRRRASEIGPQLRPFPPMGEGGAAP